MKRFIGLLFIFQSAYTQLPKTEFSKQKPLQNEPFTIKYIVEGESEKGRIEGNKNFHVINTSFPTNIHINNYSAISYSFLLVATKSGNIELPIFTYSQDNKTKTVKHVKILIDKNKITSADSIAIFDSLKFDISKFIKPIKKDDFDSTKTEIKIDYPKAAVKSGEVFTVSYRTNDKEFVNWKKVDLSPNIIIVSGPGLSTSMTIINGKMTNFSSYTYTFKMMDKGSYTIPGAIMISKRKQTQADSIVIKVE